MRMTLIAAASLLWPCAASAQTPPEGLAWMALRDINADAFDPDDPINPPPLVAEVPAGMIRAVEVSRDSRPDWQIDYQASGVNRFCGTGGCLQRLYVSTEDGYARAFDNQALALTVTGDGEVEAWVHHLYCANDSRDCRYRFAWNPAIRRLTFVSTTSTQSMEDGAYPPIDPDAD